MSARHVRRAAWGVALLVGSCVPARAQDRPALFLHGLHGVGSDWAATASRLHDGLAIDPREPNLPWRETYEQQAQALNQSSAASGLSMTPIAIGHSNGGIVAREFSRVRSVAGIATIGTPHNGAPIVPSFGRWLTFQASAPSLLNEVLASFSLPSSVNWTFSYVQGSLGWVSDFSIWSVVYLGVNLGLDSALPVAPEMVPGSPYLSNLNSVANLQREASAVPGRVGIVSIARDFYWAGPARAIYPDGADGVAAALYGTAYGVLYWGGYIMSAADPTDVAALRQATALMSLGNFLLAIDPVYCRLVSGTPTGDCVPNDGVVPYTSQQYPGAPNIVLGLDNTGPAHSQERDWSESVLADALPWYLNVPSRSSASPNPSPTGSGGLPPHPTPAPPGGGSSGGGSAGSSSPSQPSGGSGSGTSAPAPGSDPGLMLPDDVLLPDERINSANGLYNLVYQGDGNLVLYDQTWSPLWASHTQNTTAGFAAMQSDGNFVVYDAGGVARWASGDSFNHPGAYLLLQNDGNLVIYDVNGAALWATNTSR